MAKLILDFYKPRESDKRSETENQIFDLVKKHDRHVIEDAIKNSDDWNLLYNLKSERGNILASCDIRPEDECLEIGSECGAITEALLTYSKHVDCVEISKSKSEINYERNIEQNDLNIYVGDFSSIYPSLNKKYDKIFIVGTLTFASAYVKDENPYMSLLKMAKDLLKEDGHVFVAIDNKYGMKYFNGAKDEQSSRPFNSIVGGNNFSSVQLREMFKEAGFNDVYFYYPLPDYKFANIIFSEDYLPEKGMIKNTAHSLDKERTIIFSEDKALSEAASSGTFELLTNSFLIRGGR